MVKKLHSPCAAGTPEGSQDPSHWGRNIMCCCYLRQLKFANLRLGHGSQIRLKWITHFHMVTACKVVFSAQAYFWDFVSKCKRDMLWLSCLFLGGEKNLIKNPNKMVAGFEKEMSKLIQACTEKKENCFSQVSSEAVNCTDPSLPHSLFSNRL